jgi:anaerobic sulfite reductase subunit B
MATIPATEPAAPGAMAPEPYRVVGRTVETHDTVTIELEPLGRPVRPQAGQFAMLYAFGVGEVPISTSGRPGAGGRLVHTVRAVGAVTSALAASEPGDVIGVRGPFGTAWPVAEAEGGDLLAVAGGIGLAPLRPAIYHTLASRDHFETVCLLVGARTPQELLFTDELESWRGRFDLEVDVTVDAAVGDWHGRVGLVTKLIPRAAFEPERTTALVCGPEIMMAFTARALLEQGIPRDRIWVSFERNMQCGVGHCGHCQVGPLLVCRDGPVLRYDAVAKLMEVREL